MFESWQAQRALLLEIQHTLKAPFYVYDLDRLAEHSARLLTAPVNLWYAVKANPLSRILQGLHQQGMKFDVASIGELQQVLKQGVPPEEILHTGPGKSLAQFKTFLKLGVRTFVLESRTQVDRLQKACSHLDVRADALLRVQLNWDTAEKNVLGGQGVTPFGLDPEQWRGIDLAAYPHIQFLGLHIFQWGNILSTDKLLALWQSMLPPLMALADELQLDMQVLDLGGGLGIPYHADDHAINWRDLSEAYRTLQTALPKTALWMELGRYAVGECGAYVTTVTERKQVRDQTLLVTEGGINHLLRPAITQQPFPAMCLTKTTPQTAAFQIHGPLCTALDNLGTHALPCDTDSDDVLLFAQCGAYGFTESMPWFLCHTLPGEVVIQNGTFEVVRPPAAAETWLR